MAIDFMKLAEQNKLTYNDTHTGFYVKPHNRHDFTSYPLATLDGTILVTMEEYLGLRAGYYQFTESLNGLELNQTTEIEETVVVSSNEPH